ncbi:Anti-sigma regulatory factor (Ser/Thr protein kinase) [Streptomyces sp. yr375]|uniref:ATP-binding protein n=1 Tax=Streptomyces sp. yr375 TaxID=1761906 RepID=UPI0008AB1FAD|nr:ATP-binding protein [Streptomyces sp. yr375]SES34964.1 Anti-sigma regulatory factor (Ser/Thr protein kinase) [Streptomyces sp. yr375]
MTTVDDDTVDPIPLLCTTLRLTPVPTAVPCARMFVRQTLTRWRLDAHIDTAELVMSELVTNAVRTGAVIGIQLRALEAVLYVEVWDRTEDPPVRGNPGPETVGGRGLLLVEGLAKRWDVYRPRVGGKVVWAELPLAAPPEPVSAHRAPVPLVLPPGVRPPRGPVDDQARWALLDHLWETTFAAMTAARVSE